MKQKYYSLKNILSYNAQYNVIFGERSNGKTYAVLEYILKNYQADGSQGAIVRRWDEDFKGKRGQVMFEGLVQSGAVKTITKGMWTNVYYYASKWYLCRYEGDDNHRVADEKPFAYGFSITSMEHDKSTSYGEVTTIMFDEFLTRKAYLPDEFVLFMNVCSTIIRNRNNVTIFMLGNTVNRYSPYFAEMGLKHAKDMKQGTIDLYTYGQSDLKVAVEYCASNKEGKKSDSYFAFDSPSLQMITGGTWELDIYPHCPTKYRPKDILFIFFIIFNEETLQCEVVQVGDSSFIYIHRKTTELKSPDEDLIFTSEYDHKFNIKRRITRPATPIERKIYAYFQNEKVFYQDNETGEIVRNYLIWCKGV